jgi:hypothetical protein
MGDGPMIPGRSGGLLWRSSSGVPPMFAFRDPDGNGMEIVQDR